ncbi:bicyclomycin resistance protein [Pelomonas sp. V22]|uniref:ABC transporter substrate-binding protein n=1 Tax=Pelomonas sp. V22 TaxID=2822139 RepID=UPI0024A86AD4|nr:ABC transporter substrate-binding protein [Pelomonas sp. V22]MDI4634581.1 bicyclomycin resistance protein [Pelomonas sp. V22]
MKLPLLFHPGLACVALALLGAGGAAAEPAPQKVLRYAIRNAESGFDPVQINDLYSRTVASGLFETPLQYDFLARPYKLKPATAAAMPEVASDFKTLTFRFKPGIFFADDPAFGGKKRELTAADYAYTIRRHFDPRWKSPTLYALEPSGILGLSELRQEALKTKKPFDYDRPVEGLQLLDRYTLRIRTKVGNPRLLYQFADPLMAGMAREVVERYGDKIMEHPVGTGPWVLKEWRRSSRMVFEKNPNYREVYYDEQPPAGDARMVEQAAKLKGRRLPLVDRVEISVIQENQPRWLSFVGGEVDMIDEVPPEYASVAMPHNQLAPNLAKQGIQMIRYARADIYVSYFGMEHPVVGGYTPEKVALRRAISLGVDLDQEIRLARRGQAIPGQGMVGPNTFGYDPLLKTEMSEFNRAKARALLDMHGYVDKDGDGWRDQPDGSPLLLEYATQPDGQSRALVELWQKNMDALGIRIKFTIAQWPENQKASRAGKLMMWGLGWSANIPDGDDFLGMGYSRNAGQSNHARFKLPTYDRLFERIAELPDGPERQAAMREAQRLMVAYMPYKVHVHRIYTDMAQPWVIGYNRNLFVRNFWQYVDIDLARLPKDS